MNAQQHFNACGCSGCKFSTAPSLVQPNLVLLHYPLTQSSPSRHNVFLFSFVLVFFFFFFKSMTKSSAKIFFLSNRETKPRFLYVSRYLEPQGLITLTEETIRKMNHLRTHQLWTMSFCTASRASLRTLGSLWVIIFITITLHPRFSSTLEIKQVVNQQLQRTMWQAFLVGRRRLGLETIHLFPRITSKICL